MSDKDTPHGYVRNVQVHDIIQVSMDEGSPRNWGGCLVVVTEIKSWGIQGYTRVPGEKPGDAYIRIHWKDVEITGGRAVFVPARSEDDKPDAFGVSGEAALKVIK